MKVFAIEGSLQFSLRRIKQNNLGGNIERKHHIFSPVFYKDPLSSRRLFHDCKCTKKSRVGPCCEWKKSITESQKNKQGLP